MELTRQEALAALAAVGPGGIGFGTGDLQIDGTGNHTQSVSFGAAAAKYLDVFVANVQWDELSRRYERVLNSAEGSL
jgi:hypothetical protein